MIIVYKYNKYMKKNNIKISPNKKKRFSLKRQKVLKRIFLKALPKQYPIEYQITSQHQAFFILKGYLPLLLFLNK